MNNAIQKGSRSQNNRKGTQRFIAIQNNAGNLSLFDDEVCNLSLNHSQIHLIRGQFGHSLTIQAAICLRPRPLHSRSLAAVQQSKLNSCKIRCLAHNTVKRIDFADQMPLPQSTDCRIAGHCSNFSFS